MVEKLIQFFKQSPEETKNKVPEGLCPNCWGEQEFDNVIRDMYKDKQIDVNNHKENHAFIQEFVVNRLNGIHFIKGDSGLECPTCKIKLDQ
jgi:hypothetical protein